VGGPQWVGVRILLTQLVECEKKHKFILDKKRKREKHLGGSRGLSGVFTSCALSGEFKKKLAKGMKTKK